ncbi:hypothetical protein OA40_09535 [Morganella morganii]|nr:hypothetical protein OA40_09535 [Morganella morganii]
MSDIRDCINCENYRYWLEIQLVDDAGHPLDNMSFTLKERGTDKSLSGVTDGQGLFRVDGLSARPVMVTINAQDLADKLTTSMPLQSVYYPDDSLKNWCRTQGYILSEHNNAGMFNTALPERIYDMSPAQIARLHEYSACHDGYTFVWPYNQRRVVIIRFCISVWVQIINLLSWPPQPIRMTSEAEAGILAVILSRSMCRRIPAITTLIFRNDRTAPAGFRRMMITARSF